MTRKARTWPRVAVVTMVRNVGPPLESFIRYHLALGFERIYLYFDDPKDPDWKRVRPFGSRVVAIRCDAAHRRKWRDTVVWRACGSHVNTEVMARQVLNVELCLRRAEREGIDWLLHIDADELLWLQGRRVDRYFAQADAEGFPRITFRTLEAAPETDEVRDYFREVTLFKKGPYLLSPEQKRRAPPFIAHAGGKSATRIHAGVFPAGVHTFADLTPAAPTRGVAPDAFLLHYPSCGFSRYRQKYELLGNFGDRFFDSFPVSLRFHLRSRDAVMGGDLKAARALYRRHVVMGDPAKVKTLLDDDILVRVDEPARILAGKGGRAPRTRSRRSARVRAGHPPNAR